MATREFIAGMVRKLRVCLRRASCEYMDVFPNAQPTDDLAEEIGRKRLWDLLLPDSLPGSTGRTCTLNTFLNGSITPRLQIRGGACRKGVCGQAVDRGHPSPWFATACEASVVHIEADIR